MAQKQELLAERDRIRGDVEDLDGGYTTIGKILKQSHVSVFKALKPSNTPKLSTLEKIQEAVDLARKTQKKRLAGLRT